MKPLTIVITLASGVILYGCSLFQWAMLGATLSDANVLAMLDIINLSEIDSADLAKEKASSEEVRTFASRLLTEHTAMMQETRQLAQQINVDPQMPVLASIVGTRHQETMEELRSMSGADFDQTYLKYQIKMHEQAIDLVQHTADSVHNRRLHHHLKGARQDLLTHLSTASAIERHVVARY
jgi:putative membrane protein